MGLFSRGPSPEIKKIIEDYVAFSGTVEEQIEKCDAFLVAFEQACNKHSGKQNQADWDAMWGAVFANDHWYAGTRYENADMSDICSDINNKSCR